MKVLIVRVGAMGDVLHALPAVAALQKAQPDWTIDWVVDPRWAALLVGDEGQPTVVRRVHLAETKLWSEQPVSFGTMRSVLDLRKALRQETYDLVVDMQGTIRSAVIGWMAGAPSFAGYSDPRESFAAKFYTRRLARRAAHVVDQGAGLLSKACGLELVPIPAAIPKTEWAENWAENEAGIVRPLCVLGAGGGWGAKQWPTEKFGELAVVLKMMGYDVVVNAPRKDDEVAEKVVAASGGAARTIVSNVAGLIALTRRTDLFVGGDSGPTHLAATLAVPLVALFGPTKPSRNGPWGPGARKTLRNGFSKTSYKRVDQVERGLRRIEVEEVLEAIEKVLKRESLSVKNPVKTIPDSDGDV